MVHVVWLRRGPKEYAYIARSFRQGKKVIKRKRYWASFPEEKLSLKDLVWLLTGKDGISKLKEEERRKWFFMSDFYKVKNLSQLSDKDRETIIKNVVKRVGLVPCAACYIVKHGMPISFKEIFDKVNLTDTLLEYANYIAKAYTQPDFTLFEPNEYFEGKPEDYERAKQFLTEPREEQLRKK